MRIRIIFILYLAIMLVTAIAAYGFLTDQTYETRDMVYYNEQLCNVSRALEQGTDPKTAEAVFSCSLLFTEDKNYKTKLNELISSGAVIFDLETDGGIIGKAAWKEEQSHFETMRSGLQRRSAIIWLTLFLCGALLLFFIYIFYIRPFQKLKEYTGQIAKGNLDLPLPIHRNNFFGAYTESFDLMRVELKKAKEREYQANKSKKELVAELSHDIKTPVSTIKAVCEVIRARETGQTPARVSGTFEAEQSQEDLRFRKGIDMIEEKADTIARLADNMFHATLEELSILKVEPKEESSLELEAFFVKMKGYGNISVSGELPECLVFMDKLRLEQVIDNIIHNSLKYAGTPIIVRFIEQTDGIVIRIKDSGDGLPEEEMARITEKYYRGSNAEGKSGSGLGLYLAKNFMEQMKGGLELYCEDGFIAELFLRKAA